MRLIRDALKSKNLAVPKWISFITDNKYIRGLGRGLSLFDFGTRIGDFITNPGAQSGADMTASGIGLYGTLASGPGASVAAAFSFGYWVGGTFIAPHTTEPLSDLLMKWDPLDLNNSARNYPRTTIGDYARSGQRMPHSVASDVYVGLVDAEGAQAAGQFARQYAQQNNMSINQFRSGMSFPFNMMPIK
jgi:hypothetical protein